MSMDTDSSAFVDMFELPNGTEATNLMTEADLLRLPNNVEEFRALCWAPYALYDLFSIQNPNLTPVIAPLK